jgi:GAF domain-containing protein
MPPSQPDSKVHSLRESIGIGTYPWPADLEQRAMFLGAESLCGYVVSTGRPASTPNVDEPSLIPAHKVEHEKSAAVHPILYAGRIAGCLLVSSAQYNYFSAQSRMTLIEHYANLLALAFEPEEFYNQDQIQLFMMPNQSIQKAYFADFRQRVANTMLEAAVRREPVNSVQAEQIVWQELEQQLFQVASSR